MKIFCAIIFCFVFSSFPYVIKAQGTSCDQFCVENIQPDSLNPGQLIITIYFSGDSNDFINYPHVDYVIDAQGDTIADGDLAFFGQIGMTRLDYYVSTTLSFVPANFHATVYFRYDDTICPLLYPCTTSLLFDEAILDHIRIFPNPVSAETHIEWDENAGVITMRIFDSQGNLVDVIPDMTAPFTWNPDKLADGIYYLQFVSGRKVLGIKRINVLD